MADEQVISTQLITSRPQTSQTKLGGVVEGERDLRIRNVRWDETTGQREKARDLYYGSEVVKTDNKKEIYLFRETNEQVTKYDLRVKRAVLDPWVKKIIEARMALLFRKPHERELPAGLKPFIEDVDRNRTSARSFFSTVCRWAQIEGTRWVLVDMPKLPTDDNTGEEIPYSSLADEQAADHRPFFQELHADAIVDWEVDNDGGLLWLVIEETWPVLREDKWGYEQKTEYRWQVWTQTKWMRYKIEETTQKDAAVIEFTIEEERDHDLGIVPLVPFFGGDAIDPCVALPCLIDVLDHVISIYNLESDKDWFIRLAAHPIPYVISPQKPVKMEVTEGLWIKSDPNSKIEIGYMEPSGTSFEPAFETIQDLRYRIFSIALAQARKDGKQVQSADAQKEDRRIFASSLKTVSEGFEHSEKLCWELAARWTGIPEDQARASITVKYVRDFDNETITHEMLRVLADLAKNNLIPLEIFLQLLKDGEILPTDFDVKAEAVKLFADLEERREIAMALHDRIGEEEGGEENDEKF